MIAASVLIEALSRELPGDRLIVDPDVLDAISHDDAEWAPAGKAIAGVRARSEAEVQHVVRTCAELGAPVVPRGAGTGLSGGANAVSGCVVLDLSRMNQVLEIDPDNLVCRVQPGVVNNDLKAAVATARPVVPAGPRQCPVVHHRRQRGDQRGRAVLPEIRCHPRLRARPARGGRAARPDTARSSGSDGVLPKAWPAWTWSGCSSAPRELSAW